MTRHSAPTVEGGTPKQRGAGERAEAGKGAARLHGAAEHLKGLGHKPQRVRTGRRGHGRRGDDNFPQSASGQRSGSGNRFQTRQRRGRCGGRRHHSRGSHLGFQCRRGGGGGAKSGKNGRLTTRPGPARRSTGTAARGGACRAVRAVAEAAPAGDTHFMAVRNTGRERDVDGVRPCLWRPCTHIKLQTRNVGLLFSLPARQDHLLRFCDCLCA